MPIPVALLFFNVGVEIGQLVFVAAVLSLVWLARYAASQLLAAARVERAFDRLDVAMAYGIGVVAAYWLIERTTALLA
jgi:HupE / UreJ protein